MATLSQTVTITLPAQLVTEIEPVIRETATSLDDFVYQAIEAYLEAFARRKLQEQLAKQYDELAAMYDELAAELSDEVWLPLENEALLHAVDQALSLHLDLPIH